MFNEGDEVRIKRLDYPEKYPDNTIGQTGIIDCYNPINTKFPYHMKFDKYIKIRATYDWFSENELELVINQPKKYLVYNLTSHKSVNHMNLESALKLAKSTPQCDFQLYELKYDIKAKPVEIQYEAIEVK